MLVEMVVNVVIVKKVKNFHPLITFTILTTYVT